ncbi:leucine-rich repeat domain-containing protein [Fluviispira sanaruensis]|uniref:Uncharacterized protein n=1 Tax=Fluviispira sanaruensis TaxID=2493639 RepID=A0A4P2VUT4_FLUSA|nr:hypothetical protein [Fluviispira sanaruensis]BBH52642.1 hypothetical protein JCM31447_10830 [Fluviispira sanaruensis]
MKKENRKRMVYLLPFFCLSNLSYAEQLNHNDLTSGESILENKISLKKYDSNIYLVNDADGLLKAKSALTLSGDSTTGGVTGELSELQNFEIQVESTQIANIEDFNTIFKINSPNDSHEACKEINFKFQGNSIVSEVINLNLTTATSCQFNIVDTDNKKISEFTVLLNYSYKDWCSYYDSSNEAFKTARAISQTCNLETAKKKSLYLHDLKISDLSPITGFVSLNSLNLSDNNISYLPHGIFDKLSNLKWLILRKNNLKSIPKDAFRNLNKLEMIWLMENQISNLPLGTFDHNPNLNWISLYNNELSYIDPGLFNKVTKLQSIELSNNNFLYFPLDLSHFKNLYSFEINDNFIQEIPENAFNENTELVNIGFSGNKVNFLPIGIFSKLPNLVFLNISGNNLNFLTKGMFDHLTSLERLNISQNPIHCLPKDIFKNNTKIENMSEQSSINQCAED